MSYEFDSRLGEQLYRLLPEVYRTRDKAARQDGVSSGDEPPFARYLDAHGHLLDLIHATMEQQLKDALPESSQDWLLPYFAQLLAANIVAPDSEGKHAEIKHAVSWRQRKGTLKCAEEIAEAVGQMEVEIQEGWKRVAMTPRIGMPITSAAALAAELEFDKAMPPKAIRHPQLPAAMVDFRFASRAVKASATNPAARSSNFGGVRQSWRQINHHGVPCFPNSFEDVSRRTVDLRTPDGSNGHYHHKRLLAYAPPPYGFFGLDPIRITWDERKSSQYEHLIYEKTESGVFVIRNRTDRIIEISDDVPLGKNLYRIEGINFLAELKVSEGGKLDLYRVEAGRVDVPTFSTEEPALTATDCLFGELSSGGLVRLDSSTILGKASLTSLHARDCIFIDIQGKNITGVIEYSRIPKEAPLSAEKDKMTIKNHHPGDDTKPVHDDPRFISGQTTLAARAVLFPHTPESIYEGASDRGEMGYFHHGRKGRPVRITGNSSFSLPDDGGYPLKDVVFQDSVSVESGALKIVRSAAPSLTVMTALPDDDHVNVIPSLEATDCLFDYLNVNLGLARLEYCTVTKTADCKHLQASDCIFAEITKNMAEPVTKKELPSFFNCIRYSTIPNGLVTVIEKMDKSNPLWAVAKMLRLVDKDEKLSLGSNTLEKPVFVDFDFCKNGIRVEREAEIGDPGYGVLNPVTSDAIRFGAEDGGEMGAYHHKHYSLKAEAVLDKMREFLPVGIEPVLIQDTRLLHVPPKQID